MTRSKRKNRQTDAHRLDVTPERAARNAIVSAGMARRVVPVIDMLRDTGKLTERQHAALAYYREQAHQAQDDYAAESTLAPARVMGGGGGTVCGGTIPSALLFTAAIAETARIERDLGQCLDIARAVAVDDKSLTQFCIDKFGGRERYDGKGRFVAIVPAGERELLKAALLTLKFAAGKIAT